MAFTYVVGTDRGRIRRALNDVTSEAGPLPSGTNFSDAEIDQFLADEGTWQRAVAAGFEALASAWAQEYTFNADGMQVQRGDRVDKFLQMAATWRKRYGGMAKVTSASWTRVDGYSNDTTSDAESTSSEFLYDSEYVAKITRR